MIWGWIMDIVINFEKIVVNSVDSNSGIFIGGTNSAHGWSSHSKSNNGVGTLSNSIIKDSMNIIFDDDTVDAPINNASQFNIKDSNNGNVNSDIKFKDINVNGMDDNSSIVVGDAEQNGWSAHNKSNLGEGKRKGINISQNGFSNIDDKDVIDAPINNRVNFNSKE